MKEFIRYVLSFQYLLKFQMIILFCLSSPLVSYGQNIDSISILINKLKDRNLAEIEAMNVNVKIAELYLSQFNPTESKSFLDRGYTLANKQSNKEKIVYIKSLQGRYYDLLDISDSAFYYYRKVLDHYHKTKNTKDVIRIFGYIGEYYFYHENIDSCIYYQKKCVELTEKLDDNKIKVTYNLKLASTLIQNDELFRALELAMKCSTLVDQKDKLKQIIILRMIGEIYYKQDKTDLSAKYLNKAYSLLPEINDAEQIISVYNSLGLLYLEEKKYAEAKKNFFELLHYSKNVQDTFNMGVAQSNLGDIYDKELNNDSAEYYFRNAVECFEKNDEIVNISQVYFKLAELKFRQKNFTVSKKYLQEGMQMIDSVNKDNTTSILEFKLLAKLLQQEGKYKESNEALSKCLKYQEDEQDRVERNVIRQIERNNTMNKMEMEQKQKDLEYESTQKQMRLWIIIFISGFVLVLGIAILVYGNYKQKQKANFILQEKNDEILLKNEQLHEQKALIEHKNHEILSSIHYAQRIQNAILPTEELLNTLLPDRFIMYKPRDIVSGDFFWAKQVKNFAFFCAADCTGHGVPGAFMSMLGMSFLNEIIAKNRLDSTNNVLEQLRDKVKQSLHQTGKEMEQKDGMDITFCCLNIETLELQYSGAYNPLYIVRNTELIELKANRQPIAIFLAEKPFTLNEIQLEKGDCLYLFSDGFPDQMGGTEEKKFMHKNFKKLLLEIASKPMAVQKELLNKTIIEWIGKGEQTDDITVFGIRV